MAEVLFFSNYVTPYRADVRPRYHVLKYMCNLFLRLVLVSLVVNAAVGVLMLL
jgi:hypothetical protein